MQDYKKEIIDCIQKNNLSSLELLALEAFHNEPQNENLLAFVAAIVYEKKMWSCMRLVEEFVNRFPGSIHGIRIYFATLLSQQQQFDFAANEARIYLRIAKEKNQFENPINEIITESINRGFLLLTSVYTHAGARSYSKRVLTVASQQANHQWKEIYTQEIVTLDNELQEDVHLQTNSMWESFFQSGQFADELFQLCNKHNFKELAKRIDLLENHFRFDDQFTIDESEILKLVYEDNGAFTLQ